MLALWAMFVFNKFSGLMLFSFARALAMCAGLAGISGFDPDLSRPFSRENWA